VSTPDEVEIVPLTVVTRAFAARPSSLPDIRDFVRRRLTGTSITDDDVRRLCDHVAEVLLEAAGVSDTIELCLRIFPGAAELDVLAAGDRTTPSPVAIGPGAAVPGAGRTVRTTTAGPGPVGPGPVGPAPFGPASAGSGRSEVDRPEPARAVDPQLSFAAWFAARLRRESLTMEAAARRLDVSAKTISRWIAGSTEPRLRDLLRVREIFGEPPIH
jgi:hypothetical protein